MNLKLLCVGMLLISGLANHAAAAAYSSWRCENEPPVFSRCESPIGDWCPRYEYKKCPNSDMVYTIRNEMCRERYKEVCDNLDTGERKEFYRTREWCQELDNTSASSCL